MDCQLPGITLHYEVIGEGRPLIVLPGWPDDWHVPADYLEPLFRARPGWRRIYLDLPGRGRTAGKLWITSNDQVLDIVLAFLDRVIPGERFALAGHSAGAYLARAILHRREAMIDGLLQVVPTVAIDDPDDPVPPPVTLERDDSLMDEIGAELGPDVASAFARSLVVQRRDIYERFKRLLPGMTARDDPFLASLDQAVAFSVDPPPDPFPGPSLFVLGRQDSVVGYATALGLIADYPRATFAVLDRAGHALPWEQPDLFEALARDWLARVEASAEAATSGPLTA